MHEEHINNYGIYDLINHRQLIRGGRTAEYWHLRPLSCAGGDAHLRRDSLRHFLYENFLRRLSGAPAHLCK